MWIAVYTLALCDWPSPRDENLCKSLWWTVILSFYYYFIWYENIDQILPNALQNRCNTCIQWAHVIITNPPISKFNSPYNEFMSVWSMFVYNRLYRLTIPFQTLFTCLSFRYVGCIGHGKQFLGNSWWCEKETISVVWILWQSIKCRIYIYICVCSICLILYC